MGDLELSVLPGWLATANAFIEDTCVIFAASYFLSRGKTLDSLIPAGSWRKAVPMGIVLGLLASTEIIFPGMRAPYRSDTLILTLAAILGGWVAALGAGAVVTAFSLAIDRPTASLETAFVLVIVSAVSLSFDRLDSHSRRPWVIGLVGGASQAAAVGFCDAALPALGWPHPILCVISIPANAFGLFLSMTVIRDSDSRTTNERNRLDLERSRLLLVSADLAALRARIQPHFLFNTLTAIASLCVTDARQAESSILKLGRLLRRPLEIETTSLTSLGSELEYVQSYTSIQSIRFGGRVQIELDLDSNLMDVEVPPFSLQTLVENSFQHGLGTHSGRGRVKISARSKGEFVLMAVSDNGVGIDGARVAALIDQADLPRHGLGIIDKQMRLLYGPRCRLRIFSRPDHGTCVAFRIPRRSPGEVHRAI